jgi:hypothetical protein
MSSGSLVRTSLTSAAALAVALLMARPAAAIDDADVAKLADGKSQKWNWQPPGTGERYGHAEVLVNAPLAAVRKQVLDFAHWKDLVPDKFHNVRVVGKDASGTEIYMQVPVMHGVLMLWNVMRFQELAAVAPEWSIVEGWFVKGNVKKANAVWTMHKIDDGFTVVKFDLLMLPNLPAPQAAIDEELRDAAMQAVDAIHDRAQGHNRVVAYPAAAGAKSVAATAAGAGGTKSP